MRNYFKNTLCYDETLSSRLQTFFKPYLMFLYIALFQLWEVRVRREHFFFVIWHYCECWNINLFCYLGRTDLVLRVKGANLQHCAFAEWSWWGCLAEIKRESISQTVKLGEVVDFGKASGPAGFWRLGYLFRILRTFSQQFLSLYGKLMMWMFAIGQPFSILDVSVLICGIDN